MVRTEEFQSQLTFWKPSFSIGVAEMYPKIKSSSELLIRADSAMYEAQNNGGGVVRLALEDK